MVAKKMVAKRMATKKRETKPAKRETAPAKPPLSLVVQSALNAGMASGFRQALAMVVESLRAQADRCRELAKACSIWEMGDRIRLGAVAGELDACASTIAAKHVEKAHEEQQLIRAAEAMLAAAQGAK